MKYVEYGLVYSNKCNGVGENFSTTQNMSTVYKNRGDIIVNIYISPRMYLTCN